MSERLVLTAEARPRFPRHVRLRENAARGEWVLLAPERSLFPDEIAVEILRRCDGEASIAEISQALAREFGAPTEEVLSDVTEMLQDLADKGFVIA